MPVTTRSGRSYDLTASVSAADRMRRRRVGMRAQEQAIQRTEHAAGTKAARSRMTDEQLAVQRREHATGARAARSRMTDERRAVQHATGAKTAHSRMTA